MDMLQHEIVVNNSSCFESSCESLCFDKWFLAPCDKYLHLLFALCAKHHYNLLLEGFWKVQQWEVLEDND